MSLKIIGVFNAGEESERLSLLVTSDCDLRSFAVVDLTFNQKGDESNIYRHFYRFSSRNVKDGDKVRLYTGKGKNRTIVDQEHRTIHKIYWGSDNSIWNQDGDKVEVLRVHTIASKNVN